MNYTIKLKDSTTAGLKKLSEKLEGKPVRVELIHGSSTEWVDAKILKIVAAGVMVRTYWGAKFKVDLERIKPKIKTP